MRGMPILVIAIAVFASCAGLDNGPTPIPLAGCESGFRTMRDGTRVFVYESNPESGWNKTVYILSGITGINHEREADLVEALSGGVNRVVVIHPRGTGYSDGRRGDSGDLNAVLGDYAEIINGDANAGQRILFGHSMSCAMAVAIASRLSPIAGIVLVNPPVAVKAAEGMTPEIGDYVKYAWYMLFAPGVPIVNMGGTPELIGNPEERKEALERSGDPLLVKYFSMHAMLESKKLMDAMPETAKSCSAPLLLVYGEEDGIVDKTGCERLFAAWSGKDKAFLSVPGGPHGKLTVLLSRDRITEWIAGL